MTKLYPYQEEGVELLSQFDGRALLADEMGLGKSAQSLVWAKRNKKFPIVIVCPATLKWNWQHECLIHINKRSEILEGTNPTYRDKEWIDTVPIWIVNYDILFPRKGKNGKIAKGWYQFLKKVKPKLVIVDEGHYIKSMKIKRTRYVHLLCKKVPHVIVLTGTPITNSPAELYSNLLLINPKKWPSFYKFASRYCHRVNTPFGIKYEGARNLKKLHKILISTCMIRRRKKDVLSQLPPKTRITVLLTLSDQKEYLEAAEDFIGWMSKNYTAGKVRRAAKAEQLVKLGYLKRLSAKLKMDSVFEWIDNFLADTDEKLLVFAVHRTIIETLVTRYKGLCVKVTGSVKGKERQLAFNQFNKDKKVRLLFGNIRAAGTGMNATGCSNVAKVELEWDPASHSQAEDRVHRIGQTKHCTIYYLVAKGTIEEKLCKILEKKQRIADKAIDGEIQTDTLDVFDMLTKALEKESHEHTRGARDTKHRIHRGRTRTRQTRLDPD